jgi:GTPase SAR1 family protein
LIVYDVSDEKSFASVQRWIQHVKELSPDAPVAVVANKCDLEHVVSSERAMELCKDKSIDFFEVSALSGAGVDVSLNKFVERMCKEKKTPAVAPIKNTVNLGGAGPAKKQPPPGCC